MSSYAAGEKHRTTTGGRAYAALVQVGERYALVVFLGAVITYFSINPATSSTFTSLGNLQTIGATQAVTGIAALAAMIPLVCGQFDVSVGAVLGASSFVTSYSLQNTGAPLGIAILVGLGVGALVGLVNGVVIAYFGANSFVITLGTATLTTGLVSFAAQSKTLVGVPPSLSSLGNENTLGIPRAVMLLTVVAIGCAYLLRYTLIGRHLTLTGANVESARLVGVRVRPVTVLAFVASGTLSGFAGVLQLAQSGAANEQIGPGYTLPALAAAFLGSTTIRPGQFNVLGTVIGVFTVAVVVNGLVLSGAESWVSPVFNGAAVVIAVSISTVLARKRGRV